MQLTRCTTCDQLFLFKQPFFAHAEGARLEFSNSTFHVKCPNGHLNEIIYDGVYKSDQFGVFHLLSDLEIGADTNKINNVINAAKQVNLLSNKESERFLDELQNTYFGFEKIISKIGVSSASTIILILISLLASYLLWLTFQKNNRLDIPIHNKIEKLK